MAWVKLNRTGFPLWKSLIHSSNNLRWQTWRLHQCCWGVCLKKKKCPMVKTKSRVWKLDDKDQLFLSWLFNSRTLDVTSQLLIHWKNSKDHCKLLALNTVQYEGIPSLKASFNEQENVSHKNGGISQQNENVAYNLNIPGSPLLVLDLTT